MNISYIAVFFGGVIVGGCLLVSGVNLEDLALGSMAMAAVLFAGYLTRRL